jgi:hypothetical protein
MCDYSLHNVETRPAKVGDRLKVRHLAPAHEDFPHRRMQTLRSACYLGLSCPFQTT